MQAHGAAADCDGLVADVVLKDRGSSDIESLQIAGAPPCSQGLVARHTRRAGGRIHHRGEENHRAEEDFNPQGVNAVDSE